ncbi:alpha/beta fold hydrolase [Oceanobacter mangrovi]|uniref:alpha/beta fold hydrolase n=1 Tax=Oceanobacter mangrovi TaxID=2862510 RepID=UPI001C8ED5ED|nr:alpha/beta hydrolase [Oceanobacter mangrovi]
MKERLFSVDGHQLAALEYGSEFSSLAVAIHGWLDNAASFWRLSQHLQCRIIALDLPGHGNSDWLADGYTIWRHAEIVCAFVQQYCEVAPHLIGHSLGGGICSMVAGTLGEQIASLTLIDSIGPMTTEGVLAAETFQRYVRSKASKARFARYDDEQQALASRLRHGAGITPAALLPIVRRGLRADANGVSWKMDPRLKQPSPVRLTPTMLESFLSSIQVPVLAARARDGLYDADTFERLAGYIPDCRILVTDGHHHFHLEDDGCKALSPAIQQLTGIQ